VEVFPLPRKFSDLLPQRLPRPVDVAYSGRIPIGLRLGQFAVQLVQEDSGFIDLLLQLGKPFPQRRRFTIETVSPFGLCSSLLLGFSACDSLGRGCFLLVFPRQQAPLIVCPDAPVVIEVSWIELHGPVADNQDLVGNGIDHGRG
jgi:hypothetical protein